MQYSKVFSGPWLGLLLTISLMVLVGNVPIAQANPILTSDPNPQLDDVAMFQIEIDGVVQPELYSTTNKAVWLDVQVFEGQQTIRARFGNPWPDLDGEYKWSDWSDPFPYAFPVKTSAPTGMHLSK